ncbi:molybdenum cofactor biosynthesis protein MoaE [Helicobacter cinaedi]|uniref:Molybdopterin synthase catalytic subunit n=1 Tax=Helicobacter cinaedi TaxID=213 RepID=A0A377JNE4_9HELI|nr:molybdenum cofactor biosynthesis protein MoaE [Helicobacter cinaedi]STP09331.1 molybdenum cofactor biosynthesis enzyme [Helicobacter cinaedi]
MLSLYHGALPTGELYTQWEAIAQSKNCGAVSIFSGVVRKEQSLESHLESSLDSNLKSNDVEALSFDIYKPLLEKWFNSWQERAHNMGAYVCMAHSIGDVPCGKSSFMCGIISSHRKVALSLYAELIEDFKANAPIWKYDVINHKRIYAKERSKAIKGSGILCK